MTTRHDPEANAEALAALELYESRLRRPTTLMEALESEDAQLIGTLILREFRGAARQAAEGYERVKRIRSAVLEMFGGDGTAAEEFLRRRNPRLNNLTPLDMAMDSAAGAARVLRVMKNAHDEA